MSESEDNRIKRNTDQSAKRFDRKRNNALTEEEKQNIFSMYSSQPKRVKEESQEKKPGKPGLDFSKLFHNKKQDPVVVQEDTDVEKKGVESFLDEYEKLRLEYEVEGISQQSILLLQRMASAINTNPQYPGIDQTPVLKELLDISKKLMLNDFEIIIWMIWLRLIEHPPQEEKVIDFLQIIALYVKQSNNDKELYRVFEKFYSHNYPNFYARFKNSQKPDIVLSSADINKFYKDLTKNFNYKQEQAIHDFNYEVDALEAEHDKRDVHTTTKFEEEKLAIMKKEADISNAKLNYGKKKLQLEDNEEAQTRKSKRSRKAADKDLEQIQEDMGGAIVTVGNISGQGSSEGRIDIQRAPPMGFLPPSFKNNGVDGIGFVPYSSIEGKQPSLTPPVMTSNSIQGSKNIFESLFKNYGQMNNDSNNKSGNFKYMQVYIPGNSNPNSMDLGSFNINMDGSKGIKQNVKMPSEGSFQSMLPEFSKKDSHSMLFKDKSGSLDGKINGFVGPKGSFANQNPSKHPPDNQK